MHQPAIWTTWALTAMDAEAKAEKERSEKAKRQNKSAAGRATRRR